MTGTVSSTNNMEVIQQYGLDRLKKSKRGNVSKFPSNTRNFKPERINRKTFEAYKSNSRLQKSFPTQIDKDITTTLVLQHRIIFILLESPFISPL